LTIRTTCIAFAAALLVGCAAVPTVDQSKPISANLAQYKSVQVIVDGTPGIRQTAGFENTSNALRDEFTANLRSSGRFSSVGPSAGDNDALQVQLLITELNYVHGGTRAAVGIFAGRAILAVVMSVTDKNSNTALGEMRATHSSSHAQGVFSPVTSTQVTAIAKEFADKLTAR